MHHKTVEQIYQKKTPLEHILLRPDTYIGSIEHQQQPLWVFDERTQKLTYREIKYVPGLYKIFDEILVNAADNYQRDPKMKLIKVDIDAENNKISIWNNGKGIPIAIHKEHKVHVPELIFGHLLTSSNYDDSERKTTGGRNGYGAKLANIFSTEFLVETANQKTGKYYRQVFKNNMQQKFAPEILENKSNQNFTCITFWPDLAKFGMKSMDRDIVSLMTKRAYDLAGVVDGKVSVMLNGNVIQIKDFNSYCDLYLKNQQSLEDDLPKIVERKQPRWEVVASLSDGQFQQVSFVNSICTSKGGTHVNYVTDQIVSRIHAVLQKKNKKLIIKPHHIKSNLWIFVNCLIENPAFDSQTKENLGTKTSNFGSKIELTEKFMKGILDSGVVESILSVAKAKEEAKMAKQLGPGRKKAKLIGIPKLEDANDAGTKNAANCTIILTEGDSAKSLALAGIEIVGRDRYGVFPLKGKLLNVREATNKQIMENAEIQNLIKILGIQLGAKYEDVNKLRYGRLLIMTDQDHDGSHIKGLLINFIHHFWPSLLKINGFLAEFVTPIIKASKGREIRTFFAIPEFRRWSQHVNLKSYKIKYYKGLGTSTAKEAKEYFARIEDHTIDFQYHDITDEKAINLAFNKKLADQRKEWLKTYSASLFVDHAQKRLSYKDFVNKELILFSIADCARSIPSLCDGLKPGSRKILFSCFKRRLKNEIKVAQLSGYVAEHSAYHHGETSLQQTIVSMAQNFVCSNNINLLLPLGQFGTRNQGGKEAASARYIFTALNPVTRMLYPEADDALLKYLEEEGQRIEPSYYLPIIPMALVNGAEGIGTGWSTFIPCHNPRAVVSNIRRLMLGEAYVPMQPWYKGYSGAIEPSDDGRYTATGKYKIISDDELEITELPIGKWTRDYKNFLEDLCQKEDQYTRDTKGCVVEEIREYHQENRVHFVLKVPSLSAIESSSEGIIKKFKLQTSLSCNNCVLFDPLGQIRKYTKEFDIMKEWYDLRLVLYEKRKEHLLAKLRKEFETLANKVRFIEAVIEDKVQIKKVPKKEIVRQLQAQKFMTRSQLEEILKEEQIEEKEKNDSENESASAEEDENMQNEGKVAPKEFDYLLALPLWSLSQEKVQELVNQQQAKKQAYEELEGTHIHQLWNRDLDNLLEALDEQEALEERDRLAHRARENVGNTAGAKKRPRKTKSRKQLQHEMIENKVKAVKQVQISHQTPTLRERLAQKAGSLSHLAQQQLRVYANQGPTLHNQMKQATPPAHLAQTFPKPGQKRHHNDITPLHDTEMYSPPNKKQSR